MSTPTITPVTCEIGEHKIGSGQSPFVIAEIGQAHDGSLGTAHAYIDAVAKTGANAIKFQTHIAEAESTPGEAFRLKVFPQDATRFEYWQRMEFTESQWSELASHAKDQGLVFLSTPFSMEAMDLLEKIGIEAWKVGSGEVTNLPMLERMARSGKTVLVSSGMSTWDELDEATKCIRDSGGKLAIFQCTTSYPCPADQLGLNLLQELKDRYNCPVGLSDHSGTIFGSLAAISLGADMIEVHTVFSKECFGPDVSSSITNSELTELVRGAAFVRDALSNPVDKDYEAEQRAELKVLFGKSLVASKPLSSGHILTNADIAMKKPGNGIPAKKLNEILGRKLRKSLNINDQFAEQDIE